MKRYLALTALTLALVACGGGTPSNPGNGTGGDSTGGNSTGGNSTGGTSMPTGSNPLGTDSLQIQGHIANYTSSLGSTVYLFYRSTTPVATGKIDVTANFSLTAPVPQASDFFSASNAIIPCTNGTQTSNTITTTPSNAGLVLADLTVKSDDSDSLSYFVNPDGSQGSLSLYFYADKAVTISGQYSCSGSDPETGTVNVNFKQGWNIMTINGAFTTTSSTFSYTSGSSLPAGGAFYDFDTSSSAASVHTNALKFHHKF